MSCPPARPPALPTALLPSLPPSCSPPSLPACLAASLVCTLRACKPSPPTRLTAVYLARISVASLRATATRRLEAIRWHTVAYT
jgi:hypothetical protein